MIQETARVCLNSNNYTHPSGGYKAHGKNIKSANSHKSGIGMEEWLNSPHHELSGICLSKLKVFVRDKNKKYRIGFIEAYKFQNYPTAVQNKPNDIDRYDYRDVNLLINDQPNSWCQVAKIKDLRGLSPKESDAIFQLFISNGVIANMNQQMSVSITGNAPLIQSNTLAINVFSCIFEVTNFSIVSAPVLQPTPSRYRWRY